MIVSHAFYAPCKLIQKLIEIRGHEILFITLRRSKTKNQFRSESMLYLKESARKSTGVNFASETHNLQRVFRPGWRGGGGGGGGGGVVPYIGYIGLI